MMVHPVIKPLLRPLYNRYVQYKTVQRFKKQQTSNDIEVIIDRVHSFVRKMKFGNAGYEYRYSENCSQPTLYSSIYACMIYSLTGRLDSFSKDEKSAWADYINSFQSEEDGLYYDPVVLNETYSAIDWWGKRHLTLHAISALSGLGHNTRYPFRFLADYYDDINLTHMLNEFNWKTAITDEDDIDNKIMNIGCLLQYQRDVFSDSDAGAALDFLRSSLTEKIDPDTGIWGKNDLHQPAALSRAVQFAYHIYPLYFYDDIYSFDIEKIVALVLQTQNKTGGYGATLNSSACEDIDSIEILTRLYPRVSDKTQARIRVSLERARSWVALNQVSDGGFVFRLYVSMKYGHEEMSSMRNTGAMFPTWFRLLSLAYILRYKTSSFTIIPAPGMTY